MYNSKVKKILTLCVIDKVVQGASLGYHPDEAADWIIQLVNKLYENICCKETSQSEGDILIQKKKVLLREIVKNTKNTGIFLCDRTDVSRKELAETLIGLRDQGYNYRKIAQIMNTSRSDVSNFFNRLIYKENPPTAEPEFYKKGYPLHRRLVSHQDAIISAIKRRKSFKSICEEFGVTGQAFRRYLKNHLPEYGTYRSRPRKKDIPS